MTAPLADCLQVERIGPQEAVDSCLFLMARSILWLPVGRAFSVIPCR